jgi:hypothetical protein
MYGVFLLFLFICFAVMALSEKSKVNDLVKKEPEPRLNKGTELMVSRCGNCCRNAPPTYYSPRNKMYSKLSCGRMIDIRV